MRVEVKCYNLAREINRQEKKTFNHIWKFIILKRKELDSLYQRSNKEMYSSRK